MLFSYLLSIYDLNSTLLLNILIEYAFCFLFIIEMYMLLNIVSVVCTDQRNYYLVMGQEVIIT